MKQESHVVDRNRNVLREIEELKRQLAHRRASGRPMNSSLVAAYHQAIERCYSNLDEQTH